jgi:hypothetical protein
VKQVGEECFRICNELVDDMVSNIYCTVLQSNFYAMPQGSIC